MSACSVFEYVVSQASQQAASMEPGPPVLSDVIHQFISRKMPGDRDYYRLPFIGIAVDGSSNCHGTEHSLAYLGSSRIIPNVISVSTVISHRPGQ